MTHVEIVFPNAPDEADTLVGYHANLKLSLDDQEVEVFDATVAREGATLYIRGSVIIEPKPPM